MIADHVEKVFPHFRVGHPLDPPPNRSPDRPCTDVRAADRFHGAENPETYVASCTFVQINPTKESTVQQEQTVGVYLDFPVMGEDGRIDRIYPRAKLLRADIAGSQMRTRLPENGRGHHGC